jgi:CubicO group peptidase (beta-lactamase class C family)
MKRTLVFIPLSMMTVVGLWTLTTIPRTAHPGHSLGIETYPSARDLYAFTEALRIKYQLPALGVGMIHRGKIVGLGMAGERIIRSGNWATLDDAFDVASCTKSITATIAAMLVEEKKVRWDTTLAEAFPELKSSMQPSYTAVTLEQLLRHRSGLGRIMDRNDRWTAWHREHRNESPREQRRRLVANALRQPPRFAAGTDEYYTNDGYLIVGSLLEQAAEMDWETLVRTRIFQPLELKSMRHGVGPGSIEAQVWGHEKGWFGRVRAIAPDPDEYGNPPFGSPGGFLHGTVPDLLRYIDFHIRGESGEHPLLSRAGFRRLHAPVEKQAGFSLGWQVDVERDPAGRVLWRSVYHGGYSGRARANLWFGPETQWGTVVVLNLGHGGDDVTGDIFYALLREFKLLPADHASAK